VPDATACMCVQLQPLTPDEVNAIDVFKKSKPSVVSVTNLAIRRVRCAALCIVATLNIPMTMQLSYISWRPCQLSSLPGGLCCLSMLLCRHDAHVHVHALLPPSLLRMRSL
jgi:hypothetical protein